MQLIAIDQCLFSHLRQQFGILLVHLELFSFSISERKRNKRRNYSDDDDDDEKKREFQDFYKKKYWKTCVRPHVNRSPRRNNVYLSSFKTYTISPFACLRAAPGRGRARREKHIFARSPSWVDGTHEQLSHQNEKEEETSLFSKVFHRVGKKGMPRKSREVCEFMDSPNYTKPRPSQVL